MTNCLFLHEKFDSEFSSAARAPPQNGAHKVHLFPPPPLQGGLYISWRSGAVGVWGTGRGLLLEQAYASLHGCRTCVLGVQKVRTQSCRSVSDSSSHFMSAASDKVCVTRLTYSRVVLFHSCDTNLKRSCD